MSTSNQWRKRDREIARKAKADAKRQLRLERRRIKREAKEQAGGSHEQA